MKKITSTILLLSLFLNSYSQNIQGQWFFKNITADSDTNKSLKNISDDDFMLINNDGSFKYQISSIKLQAEGTWKTQEGALIFRYTKPIDTTRVYNISMSGNQKMTLHENKINYNFIRPYKEVVKLSNSQESTSLIKSLTRGLLGIIALLIISFIFSRDRKNIDWILVLKGLIIQIIFAILILKVPFISTGFEFVGKIFTKIISFTQEGSVFLFRSFETGLIESPLMNFVVMILPTVIFFSALTSLLYYWGFLQKIVYVFAWIMKKIMNLSGPESVAAAGNIFLGQTESPLLVKPYLDKMTKSEMLCLMSGGMATIAGGVLAAYIGFLGGNDPAQQIIFAKHLLAASVMSAPAAIIASKILFPETKKFENKIEIESEKIGENELEAITKGTNEGLKLAVNVGAMLLVFIALMSMANYILFKFGDWTQINDWIKVHTNYSKLSFNMILGYIFAPIAWLIGVCKEDMFLVGQLLGEKTVLNEFVAYISLGEMKNTMKFYEEKSIIIATYILCGFANFSSIGIQIGGIGALAPKRKGDLSKLGFLALIGGTLASLFTAVIVGMLI